jgi:Leucine-rich repeat (LRR) protein
MIHDQLGFFGTVFSAGSLSRGRRHKMDARASKPWRPNLKRRVAALFKEIDADGDGTLSRAEVAEKLLEDTELQAIMESVGKAGHYIFEQLDTDGDGDLTEDEFLKILDPPEEEGEEEVEVGPLLKSGLRDIGRNGDGTGMVCLSLALPEKGITSLEAMSGLSMLQSIDLSNNALTDGQMGCLDQLPYLLNLNLAGNSLSQFPALGATVNLKSADLSRNALTSLECPGHRFIKSLIVDDNQLSSLAGLAHCRCLRNLSACRNQLKGTGELAALADPTLERLLISGNQIEAVTGLEALAGLVMVDVSLNKLQSLAGLDGHPILVDLFASDNAIGGDLDVELDLMKTLPLLRTLVLRGNGVAAAESEPSYRHRVLYNLPTVLDLDGVQVLSEEKVAAQNAHGDNTELLAAVSAKYFPPGNPCEIELFPGEFGQAEV